MPFYGIALLFTFTTPAKLISAYKFRIRVGIRLSTGWPAKCQHLPHTAVAKKGKDPIVIIALQQLCDLRIGAYLRLADPEPAVSCSSGGSRTY